MSNSTIFNAIEQFNNTQPGYETLSGPKTYESTLDEVRQQNEDRELRRRIIREQRLEYRKLCFIIPVLTQESLDAVRAISQDVKFLGHKLEIRAGLVEETDMSYVDAIVGPGNSYGHMTGGFDIAIVRILGAHVQRNLLKEIHEAHLGEVNVGQAVRVATDHPRVKHLIYAPTMRTPKGLPVGTDIPYLANLAALQQINQFNAHVLPQNRIRNVIFPLMGAGTGGIPPRVATEQLYLAIRQYTQQPVIRDLFDDGKGRDGELNEIWKRNI